MGFFSDVDIMRKEGFSEDEAILPSSPSSKLGDAYKKLIITIKLK